VFIEKVNMMNITFWLEKFGNSFNCGEILQQHRELFVYQTIERELTG